MKKLLLAVVLSLGLPCQAERLPLWEAGVGLGMLSVPDYRGSDQRRTWAVPAPYLVYRGEVLRADRSGMRASLFESERVQVNLSLYATLPADTKDNRLRQGMRDLDPTVELGPTADLRLWHAANDDIRLTLRLPVRASFTLASSPRHLGWLFSPNLHLSVDDPAGQRGWKLGLQAGPLFANRSYHRYFYSVKPEEANSWRPAYAASGGYAGTQFTATLSKRYARYWVGGFLRADSLHDAAFADSPLVTQRHAISAGVALVWIFGTSSTLVDSRDE